jgi:septum formation protein
MPRLVLASTSRYRRALLERLGLEFEQAAPGVDEERFKAAVPDPRELAVRLARAKAEAVAARFPDAVVVGSDQVGALGAERLDQPGSAARAAEQLARLSGRTHELVTAVCVVAGERAWEHTDVARLTARSLEAEEIRRYVALDDPVDCAGSYKLERAGIALFERVECADHSAITGLPLIWLTGTLRALGFAIP